MILNLLSFIPDAWMVKLQYRIKMGFWPDLKKPKRFTEKIQCYKLFYRDPLMKLCVDKYDVRGYIQSIGLGGILNECYGIYETVENVDFSSFPSEFVLKDTLGGGGNSVIICKDKTKADLCAIRSIIASWLRSSTKKNCGREWVYEGRKHRIIAEKFIKSNENAGGLIDYKFFCFNGKCEYLYVIADRKLGEKAGFGIFDKNFVRLDVERCDEKKLMRNIEKPSNFKQMLGIAEHISEKFPEVRVDLYDNDGKVLFGEMTFFDGSGYMKFSPDDFDYELGEKFYLENMAGR